MIVIGRTARSAETHEVDAGRCEISTGNGTCDTPGAFTPGPRGNLDAVFTRHFLTCGPRFDEWRAPVMDLVFLAVTVALFGTTVLLIRLCDRLSQPRGDSR